MFLNILRISASNVLTLFLNAIVSIGCAVVISSIPTNQTEACIYLLLAECEVRTASYGPSFFPSFYDPSAKRAGDENKEGKKRGSITYRTDQENEANIKDVYYVVLLIIPGTGKERIRLTF